VFIEEKKKIYIYIYIQTFVWDVTYTPFNQQNIYTISKNKVITDAKLRRRKMITHRGCIFCLGSKLPKIPNLTAIFKESTKMTTNVVWDATPYRLVEKSRWSRTSSATQFNFMNHIGTFTTDWKESHYRMRQSTRHRHANLKYH
jgi:hypothetical protein